MAWRRFRGISWHGDMWRDWLCHATSWDMSWDILGHMRDILGAPESMQEA